MNRARDKAFLAVLMASTIASTSGLFIKNVEIPATSIAFIRTSLPTLITALIMLSSGIPFFRGNYKMMLGASLFNAIRMYFFFVAYIYTSIGNAVIITFTWPIFVTIFSVFFLKEVVTKRNMALLALSFTGILIVFSDKPISFGNTDFIGMAAALGTAITYSVTVIIFKKGTEDYTRTEIIFYQNLIGAFAFLPFLLMNRPIPELGEVGLIASYAILMGLIGFNFFFYGLKQLKASTASMLSYVEVISAFFFGITFLGESLTWNMVLGGGIILFTTALLRVR